MTDRHRLANRRLERAETALAAARTLAEASHWGACLNRLYYACFYSAGAMLAIRDLSPKTHSGRTMTISSKQMNPFVRGLRRPRLLWRHAPRL